MMESTKYWIVVRASSQIGGSGYEKFTSLSEAKEAARVKAVKNTGISYLVLETVCEVLNPLPPSVVVREL